MVTVPDGPDGAGGAVVAVGCAGAGAVVAVAAGFGAVVATSGSSPPHAATASTIAASTAGNASGKLRLNIWIILMAHTSQKWTCLGRPETPKTIHQLTAFRCRFGDDIRHVSCHGALKRETRWLRARLTIPIHIENSFQYPGCVLNDDSSENSLRGRRSTPRTPDSGSWAGMTMVRRDVFPARARPTGQ